jgi:AraC family transcriptional regulator
MNWQKQLEESIDYIEAHLTSDIDLQHLGRITHCSAYHYQRIFSYMVGVPLAEYVRRRKMSLAGIELQSGSKVIDVALKYGYESPNSFARAFKRVHGITPNKAQCEGSVLKSYPRIKFQIITTGDKEMEHRIESKPAFRIVGLKKTFSNDIDMSGREEIAGAWYQSAMDGTQDRLAALSDSDEVDFLGVTLGHEDSNEGDIVHYISVANAASEVPEDFDAYEVPAQTWAIFPLRRAEFSETSNPLGDLHKYVFSEWLPASGYEPAEGLDIEVWPRAGMNPPHFDIEFWLPVKKSN